MCLWPGLVVDTRYKLFVNFSFTKSVNMEKFDTMLSQRGQFFEFLKNTSLENTEF
jgi:hypothetical protein